MGTCKVQKIVLNCDQTEQEQQRIVAWHHQQLALDRVEMPGAPFEEVHCSLMDVLHLSGQRPHQGRRVLLSSKPGREYHGQHKDRNVQFPCRHPGSITRCFRPVDVL